jgi:hypothetical protein
MDSVTIDTNVLVVANMKNVDATPLQCLKVIEFIEHIINNRLIISIDDKGLILSEYRNYASHKGAPGVGDKFFKWLHDYQGSNLCEKVKIHPFQNEHFEFEELDGLYQLIGFDRSDQKFVAVALKSENNCTICNAVDSDWENYADAFSELKIAIKNVSL